MQFPQRLSCRVEVSRDGVHLIVAGELDHQTVDDFDLAVRGVLTGFPDALVLDLSIVEFISAEGTVALVDAVHRAAAICASVVILPSGAVRRRLAALGLDQALVIGGADSATRHTPPSASA
jgi:anti-anti-sigma factor